jgi:uncharacterized protein
VAEPSVHGPLQLGLSATVALAGGALAQWAGLPLAWLMGAMLAVATLSLLSGQARPQPSGLRRLAQGCIGLALGLLLTPSVLREIGAVGHLVAVGALTALALSVLAAPVMQRLSGVDGPTAIYAVALGASAEMSMQAQRAGADGAAVASAHALRIVLVTTSATALAWGLGHPAAPLPGLVTAADLALPWLAGLMVAGVLVAWGLQRLHTPNPWLLGPLIVGSLFATQWGAGRLPPPVLVAAQVVIGWALGQNLTRDFFRRAPVWLLWSGAVTLGILALCMAAACALAWLSGMPLMAAFIAMAPGGMAEMGVIAKAFGLAAPTVTAFHLARILLTVFLTRRLARWMLDSGWVRRDRFSAAPRSSDRS